MTKSGTRENPLVGHMQDVLIHPRKLGLTLDLVFLGRKAHPWVTRIQDGQPQMQQSIPGFSSGDRNETTNERSACPPAFRFCLGSGSLHPKPQVSSFSSKLEAENGKPRKTSFQTTDQLGPQKHVRLFDMSERPPNTLLQLVLKQDEPPKLDQIPSVTTVPVPSGGCDLGNMTQMMAWAFHPPPRFEP